jgi:hypothetical protein
MNSGVIVDKQTTLPGQALWIVQQKSAPLIIRHAIPL